MHKPRSFDVLAIADGLHDESIFNSLTNGIRRPFQPDYIEPKWPRDRVVDIEHIKLQVALDFKSRRIAGTATHTLAAILDGLRQLEFDAAEMDVSAVRVGGEAHSFGHSDDKLRILLERALSAGDEIEVAIDYSAKPRRGLYFIGPDAGYPDKPLEAWTQGEDEDSRYWFPCYDYPNDRVTSEIIATVPETFTAVSNGELLASSVNRAEHTRTFHWRHDVPHSSYLMSLAAGEFVEIRDAAGTTL